MWKKLIAAAGCSMLLWGGSPAMAAEIQPDVMWAYKEAYMANINDERMVDTDIDLFGPNYHWELDASGKVLRDGSMRWCGNMSWDYTAKDNKTTSHEDIPFYLEQDKGVMTIYSQRKSKWSKITLPGLPTELAAAWRNGAVDLFNESLQAVKNISLVNTNEKMQGFRIVMDAGKMIEVSQKYAMADTSKMPADKKEQHDKMLAGLVQSLTGTEVTVDWVVDKATHKTVTISTDLTPLIRGYAKGVIKEMAAGTVKLSDEERETMESLGYFSELKFYLTYAGAKQQDKLNIPADVRKNAVSLMNLADIQKGVAEAAEKKK